MRPRLRSTRMETSAPSRPDTPLAPVPHHRDGARDMPRWGADGTGIVRPRHVAKAGTPPTPAGHGFDILHRSCCRMLYS
jgi:hypothetical protein